MSAITTIFGLAAVFFAAPVVVVMFVVIKKVYAGESLKEVTSLPAEKK